ncbi:MAG TPA: PEP-CTERM sorting domain-containing protein, partial [Fimbriimonas sp.]|nr:PEP-CTERM sorting domain-containing protein [Fimbriimonas sp.]
TGFSDAINGVSVLFGYDSANFSGAGAPAGSGLTVDLSGITFASPFSGGSNPGDLQGGGGLNGSANRPWGWWVGRGVNNPNTFGITNTTATKIMDVVVNVGNLNVGDVRPITIWAPAPTDPFSGFFDSSVSAGWSPAPVMTSMSPFTGNLNVVNPVPEPASMAALGLGALALLRRRKK